MPNTVKNSGLLETEARTELRLKVMRVIEANSQMSQREIASKLGVPWVMWTMQDKLLWSEVL